MARDAFDDEDLKLINAPNLCHVATLRKDGTILDAPVWVDTDGTNIIVNSAEGRAWPENLRREGHATCTIVNADNPYEYVTCVARLVEDTHDGADAQIDKLAKKYLDKDEYPFRQEGEERVTFVLRPERVQHHGGS